MPALLDQQNVQRAYVGGGEVGPPKGRKARHVRFTEEMARALWRLRAETHAADDDLVFRTERGRRLDYSKTRSLFLKPAVEAAGVGWVTFHTFRHTRATMLFRSGWNAVQVQKFLGHSDPGFTLRTYVHLLREDLPEPSFDLPAVARPDLIEPERGDAPAVVEAR
jgi:integrase